MMEIAPLTSASLQCIISPDKRVIVNPDPHTTPLEEDR